MKREVEMKFDVLNLATAQKKYVIICYSVNKERS